MDNKIMLYSAIVIAAALLVFSVYTMATQPGYQYTPQNYQKALSSELADKCATPSGYTDAQWKQHMSHHPDRYAECLK